MKEKLSKKTTISISSNVSKIEIDDFNKLVENIQSRNKLKSFPDLNDIKD